MNSSPTKGGETLPPPSASMTAPLTSRRGHAHRRSDAISSHDLSFMLKPSNEPRGSSAPTTPSDPDRHGSFPSENGSSSAPPIIPLAMQDTPISTNHQANASFDGPSRPRVEFSDTVEFIPRPLSTISSETSSSLSTIRQNHSLTGSITSIISASTSSPPASRVTRSSLDTMFEIDHLQPRPKTASPTLHGSDTHSPFQDDLRLLKRPISASENDGGSAESDELGSWRNSGGNNQPGGELAVAPNSIKENPTFPDSVSAAELANSQRSSQAPSDSLILSMDSKRAKKQKKVSSWAGSILSRKTKHRDHTGQGAGYPSSALQYPAFADGNDLSLENITFDEDTTCVIETPVDYGVGTSSVYTEIPPWKPRESSPVSDSDTSISVLDLDAALGPFNTPKLGGDGGDDSGTSFSVSRRRMHSSGATGGFTGPGMHYHRRAESAPEMVAINYQVFGFPRLSSNAAMADVFEEEEEQDESLSPKEGGQQEDFAENDSIPGLGVNIVDIDDGTDPVLLRPEHTASSLGSEGLNEDYRAIEIVSADEEPRASVVTKSSDESTITPSLSNEPCIRRPASAPIDFAISRTHMFATPQSPSVSFPDFRSSSDVPRNHTANSSMTDRVTVGSDVPSLISNAPTMTSAHDSRFSSVGTHSSSDLPHSLPSHARPRTSRYDIPSKRSSFASLSRLVGSSHGEKSKLSIEERATPDSTDKTERKKGNRISRLMRFWKSKEKLTS